MVACHLHLLIMGGLHRYTHTGSAHTSAIMGTTLVPLAPRIAPARRVGRVRRAAVVRPRAATLQDAERAHEFKAQAESAYAAASKLVPAVEDAKRQAAELKLKAEIAERCVAFWWWMWWDVCDHHSFMHCGGAIAFACECLLVVNEHTCGCMHSIYSNAREAEAHAATVVPEANTAIRELRILAADIRVCVGGWVSLLHVFVCMYVCGVGYPCVGYSCVKVRLHVYVHVWILKQCDSHTGTAALSAVQLVQHTCSYMHQEQHGAYNSHTTHTHEAAAAERPCTTPHPTPFSPHPTPPSPTQPQPPLHTPRVMRGNSTPPT